MRYVTVYSRCAFRIFIAFSTRPILPVRVPARRRLWHFDLSFSLMTLPPEAAPLSRDGPHAIYLFAAIVAPICDAAFGVMLMPTYSARRRGAL